MLVAITKKHRREVALQAIKDAIDSAIDFPVEDLLDRLKDTLNTQRLTAPAPAAFALGSTGRPVSCQTTQPPVRARAFFHPACLSSCATRALVASFVQAQ